MKCLANILIILLVICAFSPAILAVSNNLGTAEVVGGNINSMQGNFRNNLNQIDELTKNLNPIPQAVSLDYTFEWGSVQITAYKKVKIYSLNLPEISAWEQDGKIEYAIADDLCSDRALCLHEIVLNSSSELILLAEFMNGTLIPEAYNYYPNPDDNWNEYRQVYTFESLMAHCDNNSHQCPFYLSDDSKSMKLDYWSDGLDISRSISNKSVCFTASANSIYYLNKTLNHTTSYCVVMASNVTLFMNGFNITQTLGDRSGKRGIVFPTGASNSYVYGNNSYIINEQYGVSISDGAIVKNSYVQDLHLLRDSIGIDTGYAHVGSINFTNIFMDNITTDGFQTESMDGKSNYSFINIVVQNSANLGFNVYGHDILKNIKVINSYSESVLSSTGVWNVQGLYMQNASLRTLGNYNILNNLTILQGYLKADFISQNNFSNINLSSPKSVTLNTIYSAMQLFGNNNRFTNVSIYNCTIGTYALVLDGLGYQAYNRNNIFSNVNITNCSLGIAFDRGAGGNYTYGSNTFIDSSINSNVTAISIPDYEVDACQGNYNGDCESLGAPYCSSIGGCVTDYCNGTAWSCSDVNYDMACNALYLHGCSWCVGQITDCSNFIDEAHCPAYGPICTWNSDTMTCDGGEIWDYSCSNYYSMYGACSEASSTCTDGCAGDSNQPCSNLNGDYQNCNDMILFSPNCNYEPCGSTPSNTDCRQIYDSSSCNTIGNNCSYYLDYYVLAGGVFLNVNYQQSKELIGSNAGSLKREWYYSAYANASQIPVDAVLYLNSSPYLMTGGYILNLAALSYIHNSSGTYYQNTSARAEYLGRIRNGTKNITTNTIDYFDFTPIVGIETSCSLTLSYDYFMDINQIEKLKAITDCWGNGTNANISIGGIKYPMTQENYDYYILLTDNQSENLSFFVELYNNYNMTIGNISGVMRWRAPFNVDFYIYNNDADNVSKLYENNFQYIVLMPVTGQFDITGINNMANNLNGMLGINHIDTSLAFWGDMSGGHGVVKLYEMGNYSVMLETTKTKSSIVWNQEFVFPQAQGMRYSSKVARVEINNATAQTFKIFADKWEIDSFTATMNVIWAFAAFLAFIVVMVLAVMTGNIYIIGAALVAGVTILSAVVSHL